MNAPFQSPDLPARLVSGSGRALLPSRERKRLQFYLSLLVGDIVAILTGFALAGWVYAGVFGSERSMLAAQLFLPLYVTLALYHGVYSLRSLQVQRYAVGRFLFALALAALLLNFIAFYGRFNTQFSRVMFTFGLAFSSVLMLVLRAATNDVLRNRVGPTIENVLVIDDGGPPVTVPHALAIRARDHHLFPHVDDPETLDRLGRYFVNMDRVVVTAPRERRQAWAFALKGAGIQGEIVDEEARLLGAQAVGAYADAATLRVSAGPLGLRARTAKRLFDVSLSGLALLVLSPVMVLTALAIKLQDGGPVLFVQPRMGRGNRLFEMLKFRSMRVEGEDRAGERSTARRDERVTRVGRFIRRTSIDELPQLLNVLKGDMSLVGPRPHALGSQAGAKLFWEVDGRYWHRHSLKPGVTGLAQIRGFRGATEAESDLSDRLGADLEYIGTWSLWRDLWILLQTVRVLVHHRAF